MPQYSHQNLFPFIQKIYSLNNEEKFFIINKLCKNISDDKKLLLILEKFNINHIDIYSDEYFNTSVDYLIINKFFKFLSFLIKKINFIYF